MQGIESPSARMSGRHRIAPVVRLGSTECQIICSPLQCAKELDFSSKQLRNSLFSEGNNFKRPANHLRTRERPATAITDPNPESIKNTKADPKRGASVLAFSPKRIDKG
jgi:hypothetical protein